MSDNTPLLPQDNFSVQLRRLRDNPGALSVGARLDTSDFYGNAQTWVIDSFRDDNADTVFIQRIDAGGGLQLMLPPAVTKALANHRGLLGDRAKRRQGHRLIAQRRERGDVLGNPEALRKARQRKAAKS